MTTHRWALVTGASSGLGADMARHLATRGYGLILVARRRDRLDALAAEIVGKGGKTHVIAQDLGAPDAARLIHEQVTAAGMEVEVLVNNAGFGLHDDALEIPWERELAMLQLDILALVEMTRRFAADMVQRGRGHVLQVASIGAYQPSPTYASYSAAKAFVLSHGEALDYELRPKGVTVTVISPGVTATEFLQVSGQSANAYQRAMMMTSDEVAQIGVEGALAGRRHIVPGVMNWLGAFIIRLIPRRMAVWMAAQSMRPDGQVTG